MKSKNEADTGTAHGERAVEQRSAASGQGWLDSSQLAEGRCEWGKGGIGFGEGKACVTRFSSLLFGVEGSHSHMEGWPGTRTGESRISPSMEQSGRTGTFLFTLMSADH